MPLVSVEGLLLPNSAALAYTVPADMQAVFVRLGFISIDTVDHDVTVHFVPAGDSVALSNRVLRPTLSQNENFEIEWDQVLHAGDTIHWFADTAGEVVAALDYQEVPVIGGTIDSKQTTWDSSDAGYIPGFIDIVESRKQGGGNYSVPSGKQIKKAHLVVHNTSAAEAAFGFFAVPSGATQNVKHLNQGAATPYAIQPGETFESDVTRFLTTGGRFLWHSAPVNALVGRLSVEEFQPAS